MVSVLNEPVFIHVPVYDRFSGLSCLLKVAFDSWNALVLLNTYCSARLSVYHIKHYYLLEIIQVAQIWSYDIIIEY